MIPTYQLGDKGGGVKALQAALVKAGCTLTVDGDFGPATQAAVKSYQTEYKLDADGVAGYHTQMSLGMIAMPDAPKDDAKWTADGFYKAARKCPAYHGRVGVEIDAVSIVAHTTDCWRGSMPGILQRWSETYENGACAHFMIGKRAPTAAELLGEKWPSCGVVQMVSIGRNGNHAGGARMVDGHYAQWHGNYVIHGKITHPNLVAIGIEVDNAGRLYKAHGVWVHADSQMPVKDEDVFIDDEGRGWERLTDYQLQQLGDLIDALDARLTPIPAGTIVKPNGDWIPNGVRWAATTQARIVAHSTLDPNNKTDCGPQAFGYLAKRFGF